MIAQPVVQCRPLIDVFAEIPDPRHARGKRHPLPAVLALVCVASLCGYRSYSAIAAWARVYPRELVVALGFTHLAPPCPATLSTILRQLDLSQIEEKLGALPPIADSSWRTPAPPSPSSAYPRTTK